MMPKMAKHRAFLRRGLESISPKKLSSVRYATIKSIGQAGSITKFYHEVAEATGKVMSEEEKAAKNHEDK